MEKGERPMEFVAQDIDLVVITGDPVAFLLKEDSLRLPGIRECSTEDLSRLIRLTGIFIVVIQYLVTHKSTFQELLAIVNKIQNKDVLMVAYCLLADRERKNKFKLTKEEEQIICQLANATVRK